MVSYNIISNTEAIRFLKRQQAQREQVAISDAKMWVGASENDSLVGVCGVSYTKNTVRIKGFYVAKLHRGSGVGTGLVRHIIYEDGLSSQLFRHKPKATVFATENSKGIFSKFGFKSVELRSNNITFMERDNLCE